MAERRMFAKTIVTSDAFLDMPLSTRCLYFTLAMFADDDGFVNNPKSIMRQVGASIDDLNVLIAKRFILTFESGVIVIKHWKIHNYIAKDRYKETKYLEEKSQLSVDPKGAYTECIQDVYKVYTQDRIGEAREREVKLICSEEGTATKNEFSTDDEINPFRGSVFLSENQIGCLINEMGLTAFDDYVERLNVFIINNNAKIEDHFSMILKWYNEDKKKRSKHEL